MYLVLIEKVCPKFSRAEVLAPHPNIILHYYEIQSRQSSQQLKHEHPVAQDETLNRTRNENPLREARQLHRPLSFSPRRPSLFNRFLERKRECTSNDISPPWFTRLLPPCVTCKFGYKYVRPLITSPKIAKLYPLVSHCPPKSSVCRDLHRQIQ